MVSASNERVCDIEAQGPIFDWQQWQLAYIIHEKYRVLSFHTLERL